MVPNDPIDLYLPEMRALLRKVFEAGGTAKIQELVALAGHAAAPAALPRRHGPDPVLPGIAPAGTPKTDARPRYAYGIVKAACRAVFRKNGGGLTRDEVRVAASQAAGVAIDDDTIKSTLKVMGRDEEVIRRDGKVFPGPKLKQQP